MENTLPLDQQIVDLYFSLSSEKKKKDSAWLLGMIATYGVKPDRLKKQPNSRRQPSINPWSQKQTILHYTPSGCFYLAWIHIA